ncbi:hypothetical protein A3K86_15400 [Photobacterium jeanii]|uniref:Uncharacterized protein n=1 Tax=Photobacterium jeanii TaxID=858640 RepID=A0A178K6T5_9GAMM|nr:hypothetical protein [Photobacterium jeanii]OAN13049.1 hypothetical protein A3K86_15400 [Photobacterium jeanii]PST89198.1 hypothetical protein C9I91_13845 [Photobacterium jeanii]
MQQNLLIILAVIWLGLSVGSMMLFQRGKDAERKRQLWPKYTIFSNTVLAGFIVYMQPPLPLMIGLLVFMVPLTVLTIRSTKFCDSCGSASRAPFFMKPPTTCGHCKKPLK